MTIRPWRPSDSLSLRPLIQAFLDETPGDVAATRRSVGYLLTIGLAGARAGFPCLVAEDGDALVGYVLWTGITVPCDTRGAICQAFGTYVVPERRRDGIATALWHEALTLAGRAGCTRVSMGVYAPHAQRAVESVGFVPVGTIYQREVGCGPP